MTLGYAVIIGVINQKAVFTILLHTVCNTERIDLDELIATDQQ